MGKGLNYIWRKIHSLNYCITKAKNKNKWTKHSTQEFEKKIQKPVKLIQGKHERI